MSKYHNPNYRRAIRIRVWEKLVLAALVIGALTIYKCLQ